MSASNLSRTAFLLLVIAGALAAYWRWQARQYHIQSLADSHWQLTYDVQLQAGQASVGPAPDFDEEIPDEYAVRLALPQNSSRANVTDEKIFQLGLTGSPYYGQKTGTRLLKLITPQSGEYRVFSQFEIEVTSRGTPALQTRPTALPEGARARFTGATETYPVQYPAVQRLLAEAPKDVSDSELLQWIFTFCSQRLLDATREGTGDDVQSIASFKDATPLGRARMFVTLCRGVRRSVNNRIVNGFPARLVTGFELRQAENARPIVWAEVFHENKWIPFDPVNGYPRRLPDNYLAVRFGGDRLAWGRGVEFQRVRYSISRMAPPEELLRADEPQFMEIFDLTRLPIEMHKVMSLLLLLPLGALITAIFRNMVGIRTFGTFAPALLALSFIYADWSTGVVILIVVMLVGFAGRTMLERLHLLMVPRLSIVLTLIILGMVFAVSGLEWAGRTPSSQAVLLPLVILTILIERLYVVSEEDGMTYAVQLAIGTLVVSAFCYMLLRWDDVGRFILVYPELHLFTLAAFVGIGRYTGYRLTELWRFRDLLNTDQLR